MLTRPYVLFIATRSVLTAGAVALLILILGVIVVRGNEHPPLRGLTVVVDPGHGGTDPGVCYSPAGLIEREINLDVAKRVKAALEQAGATVLLTREANVSVALDSRSQVANDAKADLFLSIHTNRIPGHPECFGAQTFFYPDSTAGQKLAAILQNELIKIDPANTRAPLPGRFKVLRLSEMPGALVEIGFMTNARDRGLIASAAYRGKITHAIVRGVIRFVNEQHMRTAAATPP